MSDKVREFNDALFAAIDDEDPDTALIAVNRIGGIFGNSDKTIADYVAKFTSQAQAANTWKHLRVHAVALHSYIEGRLAGSSSHTI